jgi:hypothetical protein
MAMAGRTPFILIPSSSSSSSSPPPTSAVKSVQAPSPAQAQVRRALGFKPPAHIHARQLHSIPPSSINTRTLILEQTLSELASTRLAAAKATLNFGGITNQIDPDSVRHSHEFCKGYMHLEQSTAASTSTSKQDGNLAPKLESKANGISNVLCAILAQEPAHGVSSRSHQKLPNDVRFRLVLAILLEHYFTPSFPKSSPSKDKEPEIPLNLAPFVSLSSYRASAPFTSTCSAPTLPPVKSLISLSSSGVKSPHNRFAAFSAPGVSTIPVKPTFLGAGPSGIYNAPPTPRPIVSLSPAAVYSGLEKDSAPHAPVPVFKWPSQVCSYVSVILLSC